VVGQPTSAQPMVGQPTSVRPVMGQPTSDRISGQALILVFRVDQWGRILMYSI
jgi:hypothetical protein